MDEKSRRIDGLHFSYEQLTLLSRLSKNSSIAKEESIETEKIQELKTLGMILETSEQIMLVPGTCATEKILTEILPDLREAILTTIYANKDSGKTQDLIPMVDAVKTAVEALKDKQHKTIKESFSLLRKQIDHQIERTKYQAIQSFATLSSEFSSAEKLPELNLDINPFEIRESFENVKRSVRSILMGHSTRFEEEITRLSSVMLTKFEGTIASMIQQIEGANSKILNGLTETREQVREKIDDLTRVLVRETEILQYELEKTIKTLPLDELRTSKKTGSISEDMREQIIEMFDSLVDNLIILIRRTVDKVWDQINETVVKQLPEMEKTIENNLKKYNQEITFLLKEEEDVFTRIQARAKREHQLAKNNAEAVTKYAQAIKEKIIRVRDFHHKSSLSLARKASSVLEKQQHLAQENEDWKDLGVETAKTLENAVKIIEESSATLDPSTQSTLAQAIVLLNQALASTRKKLEEQASSRPMQEEINDFVTRIYAWIDQIQEKFNGMIGETAQEMNGLSEKAAQLSSSLEITNKDIYRALENHRRTADMISEALLNCKIALKQQYGDFRKGMEKTLAEEFVTLRSRMITPMQQTVKEKKDELHELMGKARSAAPQSKTHHETGEKDTTALMIIIKPALDDFQTVITQAIRDTRYGLEGAVLGGINIVRRSSSDTSGQFRKKIINIKEEFLRTREQITLEMRSSLETINERLIHAFNQIELRLGRVIDNLLESYDALLGANPEMLKSAFVRTNETISSLLDRLLSKLLEDTNDINQALMKQEALVRLENSVYAL